MEQITRKITVDSITFWQGLQELEGFSMKLDGSSPTFHGVPVFIKNEYKDEIHNS